MFILSCNLIGLVPGLESPTAVPMVPLGCALLTWFYYHYARACARTAPFGYLKHFIGPQEGMPLVVRILLADPDCSRLRFSVTRPGSCR